MSATGTGWFFRAFERGNKLGGGAAGSCLDRDCINRTVARTCTTLHARCRPDESGDVIGLNKDAVRTNTAAHATTSAELGIISQCGFQIFTFHLAFP
jgi:hypothetical protein